MTRSPGKCREKAATKPFDILRRDTSVSISSGLINAEMVCFEDGCPVLFRTTKFDNVVDCVCAGIRQFFVERLKRFNFGLAPPPGFIKGRLQHSRAALLADNPDLAMRRIFEDHRSRESIASFFGLARRCGHVITKGGNEKDRLASSFLSCPMAERHPFRDGFGVSDVFCDRAADPDCV